MKRLQAIRDRRVQLAAEATVLRESLRTRNAQARNELVALSVAVGVARLFKSSKAGKSALFASLAALVAGWLVRRYGPSVDR